MFKKAVHYDDLFNEGGDQLTEVLHFHLFLAQIIDLDLEAQAETGDPDKGLEWQLGQISKKDNGYNGAQIMNVFKKLMKAAYGTRDGDQFIQSTEKSERFIRSAAFDAFLRMLLTDEKLASQFVNGIMPRELLEQANRTIKDTSPQDVTLPDMSADMASKAVASGLTDPFVPGSDKKELVPWWNREPRSTELAEMTHSQLTDAFRRKSGSWIPPTA